MLAVFLLAPAPAAGDISLPPEMRARRFVRSMSDAVQENDHARVVELYEHMRARDDFELDSAFRFYFARSLMAMGRTDDALRELELFFNAPEPDEDLIDDALELLERAERARNLPPREEMRRRRDAIVDLFALLEAKDIHEIADGALPDGTARVVVTEARPGAAIGPGTALLVADASAGPPVGPTSIEDLLRRLGERREGDPLAVLSAGETGGAALAAEAGGPVDLDLPLGRLSVKTRAWMGMALETIPPGREFPDGAVLVGKVLSRGDGVEIGLKSGDMILSVDDREVGRVNDVQAVMGGVWPRDTVKVRIVRDGAPSTLTVPVEQRFAVRERERLAAEEATRREEARRLAEAEAETKRQAEEKLRQERAAGTAVIRAAKVCDYNATQNGATGFHFHLDFDINHRQGQECQVMVLVFDANGRPAPIGRHAEDMCAYHTTNDQLRTFKKITPGYEKTVYNEFHLFIPCILFSTGYNDLRFQVEISSNGKVILRSGMYPMRFNHNH